MLTSFPDNENNLCKNWEECKKNITDYINPIYKKFRTKEEATNFIEEYISMSNNKLYHLLTDKGSFKIENVIIKDYNAAIDRFLEI